MKNSSLPQLPKLNHPDEAIERMCGLLARISSELVSQEVAAGRVLAESIVTDRPSPPMDVSAMDGYALRSEDIRRGKISVIGCSLAGHAPPLLREGNAVRIFTGAPVPQNATLVVKREDTHEESDTIELKEPLEVYRTGQNIRRQGENAATGSLVLSSGQEITAPRRVALATFGADEIRVYRRIRLSIVNTGDELIEPGQPVLPWQIRDSNGPLLASLFKPYAWIELINRTRVADQYEVLKNRLQLELQSCDALLLTGGVSMGDTDHVPSVLRDLGARIVFHKLPIRPGKPVLGAIGPTGQAILALPGNPVSVAATAMRIALPVLKFLAGLKDFMPKTVRGQLVDADQKSIPLHWYRPIQLLDPAPDGVQRVRLTPNLGSGDVVALSSSDGFIEVPADCKTSSGPWNCWMFEP